MAGVAGGELQLLENGRRREDVARLLVNLAADDPELVVGLDFAFSFPAWYLDEAGLRSAHRLWDLASAHGERWLTGGETPFWGLPGRRRPDLGDRSHYRLTELTAPATAGIRPKSAFQVGGAGAVGTGSIRGMATLSVLHRAGFSIWPFDPPALPRVVEIYPRLLTGPVIKSDRHARERYLAARYASLDPEMRRLTASTEDAFDAAVSALVMSEHADELSALPPAADARERIEGRIWAPEHRTCAC